MNPRIYTSVYAVTLLLSAALLFVVQPMFSKMILPLLGGTSQVWNTAMVFFQLTLLAGYAYAHGTTRFLGVRPQAMLHIALLVLFIFVLPIAIPEGWEPPRDKDPTFWQLSLMLVSIGGPFFVLSGSAPMFQRWFAQTDHPDADNPYFLYGASNLGSMSALLAYPVIVEPLLSLNMQSLSWAIGYGLLAAMTCLCAFLVWPHASAPKKQAKTTKKREKITWSRRLLWLALAAVPSSLMLGVTTYITTDIASVPLLWVIPLALYVGTFILVFARKQWIAKDRVIVLQGLLFLGLMAQLLGIELAAVYVVPFHIALFFFSALLCHMELAESRPGAENLTEFYLLMSVGGAIGGIFNALIAPQFFVIPLEYGLGLAASFIVCAVAAKSAFPRKFMTLEWGALLSCCYPACLFILPKARPGRRLRRGSSPVFWSQPSTAGCLR